MHLETLRVHSRVLRHSQGAVGRRAWVLGCNQEHQGCSWGARGGQHDANAGVLQHGRMGRALVLCRPIEEGVVEGAGIREHELDGKLHLLVVFLPGVDGKEEQAAAYLSAHH